MRIRRVLLCVDGSPAALEAARLAIGLAADWGATVRAIYVVRDSEIAATIDAAGTGGLAPAEQRLESAASGLLSYVESLGRAGGVAIEAVLRRGEPVQEILRDARTFRPDVIAIGRAGRRGPGPTVVGTVTEHLLEFAEWPVIVVPARDEEVDRPTAE